MNWRSEIKESIKSKLYSSYKSKIEISPDLVHIHNRRYRNCFTKFRLSDHQLEIEIGRHKKKDRNDRLCNICNGGYIENEIHFLLHCSAYQNIRNSFFKAITILEPNFMGFSDNEKMVEKSKLITTLMSEFVYDLFEKRKNHSNFQTLGPRHFVIYICLFVYRVVLV